MTLKKIKIKKINDYFDLKCIKYYNNDLLNFKKVLVDSIKISRVVFFVLKID